MKPIVGVSVAILLVILGYWGYTQFFGPGDRACTLEAKLCPDGSYVGRTGPNCEFSACPGEVDTSDWKTYRNEKYGFEVMYPPYFQEDREPRYEEDKEGEREGDALLFLRPSDPNTYAEVMALSIIDEPMSNYKFRDPFQKMVVVPEKVTVGGLAIYAVDGLAVLCWEHDYYIPRSSFMVKFAFSDCGEDHRTVAPKMEILSTFKFIK